MPAPRYERLATAPSLFRVTLPDGTTGEGPTRAAALAAAKGEPPPPDRRGRYMRPAPRPRQGGEHRRLEPEERTELRELIALALLKLHKERGSPADGTSRVDLAARLKVARVQHQTASPALHAALSAFVAEP